MKRRMKMLTGLKKENYNCWKMDCDLKTNEYDIRKYYCIEIVCCVLFRLSNERIPKREDL